MKIAIPMFHTKISPRFDQTQGFVLLETQNAGVVARDNLTTKGWSVIAKMKQLVDLEVDVLICGGIDRASLQYLSFNGVKIYSWVTGEVDDAVTCFLDNRMKPGIILGDKGKMKGRWQFCKGRNHLCNMFQTGFYKGMEIKDQIPANQIFGKARLFFQDFIAPFYMYLHSNYSQKTISIDDELMPSEIKLISQIDNFVINRKVDSWSYEITIDTKGIKEITLNKKSEKITAKQVYSK